MTTRVWSRASALVLAAVLAADTAQASDAATAEALFQEGRRLMAEGNFDEACPRLAESNRLDPGVGVLLYLGDCYERAGKLASAWATFQEAIPPSRKAGQRDREQAARERAAVLEPRLPKLLLTPPRRAVSGLVVVRDGTELSAASLGLATPVDAGVHVVELRAPGYLPARLEIVAEEGQLASVQLPELERAPEPTVLQEAATSQRASEATGEPAWTAQHTVGALLGGAGLVGVGLGVGFGLSAMSDWSAAEDRCAPGVSGVVCDAAGVELAGSAETASWVSTVGFAAGGALLAVGAVVYLSAGGDSPRDDVGLRVLPLAGPDQVGVVCSGSF